MKKYIFLLILVSIFYLMFGSAWADTVCTGDETKYTPSTPTTDFIIHDNGTLTHRPTELMWMRCSMGQVWDGSTCSENPVRYNWEDSFQAARDLNAGGGYAGYTDWRVPNILELSTIAEQRCREPAVNDLLFPATPSAGFWSSLPSTGYDDEASVFSFKGGGNGLNYKSSLSFLRLVRGGREDFSHSSP
ncbi:MAG: DUF1566 domain-containing protein [Candidatus Cloacimonetes bacterium]|jgi:hypothetical protein|nr:DUF1566 domain-containing protein [Candidatus Cloacimonadota bacterium]MDY0173429.1 DUF1566 domain-containing protein [Candidatus Cloacimonadaceae bacterium]